MMNKEMAALKPSVGADEGQPESIDNANIITEDKGNFNEYEEYFLNFYQDMSNSYYLPTVTMTKLYDTVYKPKIPIVDNFLYGGTYLFAGAPKVGKSFFMAQLAYYVSEGIRLWEYPTHKGTVLYLALEDDYARLQKRMSRMFGTDSNDNLHFATKANHISGGLDKQLEYFVSKYRDTRLIIIDTLQKVRELGGENYSYASDYDVITKIKQFTDTTGICIVIVHHTRKQAADDTFDTISGTNGLMGAADGAFILQKAKRTDNNAILEIVGRDQQEQRLKLCFNREKCIWKLVDIEVELWKEPFDKIIDIVAQVVNEYTPEWRGTASELITELGLDIQANTLTRKLNINVDRLFNDYNVIYENSRTHSGRFIKLKFLKP